MALISSALLSLNSKIMLPAIFNSSTPVWFRVMTELLTVNQVYFMLPTSQHWVFSYSLVDERLMYSAASDTLLASQQLPIFLINWLLKYNCLYIQHILINLLPIIVLNWINMRQVLGSVLSISGPTRAIFMTEKHSIIFYGSVMQWWLKTQSIQFTIKIVGHKPISVNFVPLKAYLTKSGEAYCVPVNIIMFCHL